MAKYADWQSLASRIQEPVAESRAINAASTLIGPNNMPSDAQINAVIAELVHAVSVLSGGGGLASVTLSPSSLSIGPGALAPCSVIVTDANGQPVAGALVGLASDNTGAVVVEDTTGTSVPSVTTGADGTANFDVFGAGAGNAHVTATALGITSSPISVVVGAGTPTLSLPAVINVANGGTAPLIAHLVDGFGNPIVGQEIDFQSSNPAIATVSAALITDSNGAVQATVTAVANGQTTITASALGVTATATATVQAAVTGAQITIAYTDYSSTYQSTAAANAQMAFIAAKTNHKWKIVNGLTPAGGYPANVTQIPYSLMEQVKCYDAGSNILVHQISDYNDYCAAHSLDPEDGYLHYVSGDPTLGDIILSIANDGTITLKYDTQTNAQVYAVGQQVTIAGNSNSQLNGAWTVTAVAAPAIAGQSATVQINSTTGATGTGGTLSRTGDGTKTLPNRYRTSNPPFTPFWHINPASSVRRAYEIDRLGRILGLYYTGAGIFVDSMSENIFPAGHATLEYNPANSAQYYTDMAALIAAIRGSMPAGHWRYQINTAAYATSNMAQIIAAAGSSHMESIMKDHSAGYWPGVNQTFVANELAAGNDCEILNDVSVADTETAFGAGLYANDPVPVSGNAAAMRYTIQTWINALMVWDGGVGGGELAVNLWNDLWGKPTYDTGGIDSKWLGIVDYPFGTPTAAAVSLVSGVTDPLGQSVSVHSRAYGNNLVVYRETGSGTTTWSDGAAYTVTLPLSTGSGNKWQRVRSDGTLDVAISTIDLRPMEGAMLVPAGGSVALAPASGSVAVGQTIPLTVTVLDASSNPVNGQVVTLTSSVPGDATVPASVTTDSAGQATFNVTGIAAGSSNITATANNITSPASVITVTGASATAADSIFAADSIVGLSGGAGVATWPNDADNTRNATQSTATLDPIWRTNIKNKLPMVFYIASNPQQFLQFTSLDHAAITWFFVFYHPTGASTTHHGAMLANPGYRLALIDGTSPYVLQFVSHRSTTDGIWQITTGVTLPGTIIQVAYDSSSVANVPTVKINGTVQAMTTVQAPVGTQVSSAGTATIGNDTALSANDATYGYFGEITLWGSVLGAGDESAEGQRLGTKWAIANSY